MLEQFVPILSKFLDIYSRKVDLEERRVVINEKDSEHHRIRDRQQQDLPAPWGRTGTVTLGETPVPITPLPTGEEKPEETPSEENLTEIGVARKEATTLGVAFTSVTSLKGLRRMISMRKKKIVKEAATMTETDTGKNYTEEELRHLLKQHRAAANVSLNDTKKGMAATIAFFNTATGGYADFASVNSADNTQEILNKISVGCLALGHTLDDFEEGGA